MIISSATTNVHTSPKLLSKDYASFSSWDVSSFLDLSWLDMRGNSKVWRQTLSDR